MRSELIVPLAAHNLIYTFKSQFFLLHLAETLKNQDIYRKSSVDFNYVNSKLMILLYLLIIVRA